MPIIPLESSTYPTTNKVLITYISSGYEQHQKTNAVWNSFIYIECGPWAGPPIAITDSLRSPILIASHPARGSYLCNIYNWLVFRCRRRQRAEATLPCLLGWFVGPVDNDSRDRSRSSSRERAEAAARQGLKQGERDRVSTIEQRKTERKRRNYIERRVTRSGLGLKACPRSGDPCPLPVPLAGRQAAKLFLHIRCEL